MTLACAEARLLASDMLDRDLPAKDRDALLAHIGSCPSCPQLYRSMAALYERLHAADPAVPPEDLGARVRRIVTDGNLPDPGL